MKQNRWSVGGAVSHGIYERRIKQWRNTTVPLMSPEVFVFSCILIASFTDFESAGIAQTVIMWVSSVGGN